MPIPACNCDAGVYCDASSSRYTETDFVAYALPDGDGADEIGKEICPTGTQFAPPAPGLLGVGGYTCSGGSTGWTPPAGSCRENFEFSIVDEVRVPDAPGAYWLQWRMDGEQTAQVWNSCADVVIE